MTITEIREKLQTLDGKYFSPDFFEDAPRQPNQISLPYILATYCYDCDFDVDERSWVILESIGREFGSKMRERVLHMVFHRHHDT